MTENYRTVFEKIISHPLEINYMANPEVMRLAREYLRRAALWAAYLECTSEFPFFNIPEKVSPATTLPDDIEQRLTTYLTASQHSNITRRLLHWSVIWAKVREEVSELPDLPDPYESVLLIHQLNGSISLHKGIIQTPIAGFQLQSWQYYLG